MNHSSPVMEKEIAMKNGRATGTVVNAFGNLLQVRFEGEIRQGEVAMVELGSTLLKAEVIEIVGERQRISLDLDPPGGAGQHLLHDRGKLLQGQRVTADVHPRLNDLTFLRIPVIAT